MTLRLAATVVATLALATAGCQDQTSATATSTSGGGSGGQADGGVSGADGGSSGTADAAPAEDKKLHAWVFASDPITDQNQPTEVVLTAPTDPEGKLTGAFVNVSNCLQEPGGEALKQGGFTLGHLCLETQTVTPAAGGSYLHVTPPEDHSDGNDSFAEVQMYYHVNKMHDYFSGEFGLHDLDYPLYSLVNVTFNAFGKWQGFPNAAFMPKEAFAQFGLPPRDEGAIVFGQHDKTDFCYDASVIYHEYTHAMVGTTRLNATLVDAYGLDNLPGAMNEGFADYFSCSMRDSPLIGPYALGFAGEHYRRDLSKVRKCPDDLTSEIHADGKIIGSALWALRGKLGRETTDSIVLGALQQFSKQTNLEAAAKLLLNEAKTIGADTGAAAQAVLQDHGLLGCVRAKALTDWSAAGSADKVPYTLESKSAFGGGALPDGVPGYVQFYVEPPKGKTAVKITFSAETQGGFGGFGGGGGAAQLGVAVRKGKTPLVGLVGDGSITADAKVVPAWTSKKNDTQALVLSGNCLAAGTKTYLMFLNKEESQAAITNMTVQYYDSDGGLNGAVTCTK